MSASAGRIRVVPEQLLHYARGGATCYVRALDHIQTVFDRYDISGTPLRAAHFAAQVLHESFMLSCMEENLHYHAEAIVRTWPDFFKPKGCRDPHRYAGNPCELADLVYGCRYGNTDPHDGYRFRGRGLLQLTFRGNYADATRALRAVLPSAPDLCVYPDCVSDPLWALEIAAALWKHRNCNHLADCDKLAAVTRMISGSHIGLRDRHKMLLLMKPVFNA